MKIPLTSVLIILCLQIATAFSQLSDKEIRESIWNFRTPSLRMTIDAMEPSVRSATVLQIARMIQDDLRSPENESTGMQLLGFVGMIADEKSVVAVLKPYLQDKRFELGTIALMSLRNQRGPEAGSLLKDQIELNLKMMPLSFVRSEKDIDILERFVECLKGLWNSDKEATRKTGDGYYRSFKERIGTNATGSIVLKELDEEFRRGGFNRPALDSTKGSKENNKQ